MAVLKYISNAHHFLIAIAVHGPILAVVTEAHIEGGYKVITVREKDIGYRCFSISTPLRHCFEQSCVLTGG